MEAKPLVVIIGPTASGKTALAIDIAKRFNGEIICADSRTIYKDMNIGTAKPTKEEQDVVKHWGIDLVRPDEQFTVSDFKTYVVEKIDDIRKRGKLPMLVGGSGLYVDAVIFDYQFGPKANKLFRQKLEGMTLDELHSYCSNNNITLPENEKNKRYVIRAIEQKSINNKRRDTPIEDCFIVGISTYSSVLRDRITQRSEQIFGDGVIEEAKFLGNKYGWNHEAMSGNIYPLCKKYLEGSLELSQIKEKFVTLDWRLAKRQLTWFRRNEHIIWLEKDEASKYIEQRLESEQ